MASGIFYPAASGDDGDVLTSSFFYDTKNELPFGNEGNYADCALFVRFPNVTIPAETTITSAVVKLTAYDSDSSATMYTNCYFEDADDPIAPTSAGDYQGRTLTNPIAWNSIVAWIDGTQYDTPELASILQTIINRGDWSSGNAVLFSIENDGTSYSTRRRASSIDYLSGAEKAELHVTWSTVDFTFTGPTPTHLSTVYGTTEQVCLTTTISGTEPEYVYDASFYDSFDVQIGTTVSSIQSGQPAESNEYLSTPSGIDYSWYMTATSSGGEGTSDTYTFHNRFLYEGYVTENDDPVSRKVNLYYRNTGELVDTTTSSGSNGYYKLSAANNDTHFIVTFDDEAGEDYNALILDKLLPVRSE